MPFSFVNASLEGFRLIRRTPMVLAWWALAYLAFFILVAAVVAVPVMSMMPHLQSIGPGATFEQVRPLLGSYLLILALMMPLGLLFGAIFNAAIARAVIFPQQSGFGYLRLGMDEVRVAGVSLVVGLIFIGLYIILGGLAFGLTAAAGGVHIGLGVLTGMILFPAMFAAIIWVAIRLGLAIPITVAERRFAPFDSFAMTRGRFWPMLGMAIVAVVLAFAVSIAGSVITLPLQMISGDSFEQAMLTGDIAIIAAAFGPLIIVSLIVNMVVSMVQSVVMTAPFSAAYVGIRGPQVDEVSRTFE